MKKSLYKLFLVMFALVFSGFIVVSCDTDTEMEETENMEQMGEQEDMMENDNMMGETTTGENNYMPEHAMAYNKPIDLSRVDANGDGKVYQCQDQWNVLSDVPDKCPGTQTDLVEVNLEEARKNLTDNGFEVVNQTM